MEYHKYGEAMGAVKTTIMMDERLLKRLRESMLRRHGSYRKLGETVEESVKMFDPEGTLAALLRATGTEPSDYPSCAEVIASRPKIDLSAGRVIREMRDDRVDRVSGLERSGKEIR
jgi:hypothetical protein